MKAVGMDESTMFISYSVTDGLSEVRFSPYPNNNSYHDKRETDQKSNKKHEGIQQTHFTYTDTYDLLVRTCKR